VERRVSSGRRADDVGSRAEARSLNSQSLIPYRRIPNPPIRQSANPPIRQSANPPIVESAILESDDYTT